MASTTQRQSSDSQQQSQAIAQQQQHAGELDPFQDILDYAREYAREKPGACALWCLGVGFVLGWKLKPW